MNTKRVLALVLALMMTLTLFGCGEKPAEDGTDDAPKTVTITDMIGRQVEIVPGSYQRVVCIGAGALRLYSYVGDVSLLCGVEDIDNTTLEERPKMFDGVARPYVMVYGDTFAALPSCGVGGPNAQAAEAEKILACQPDIIISEYKDVEKADALQEQVGVPVITTSTGPDGVFDDAFRTSLQLLGQLFGRQERTQELIAFIDSQTAELTSRTAGVADEDRPGVYICGLGNWGTTDHLMTSQSYAAFRVANIRNVATDLGKDGVQPIEAEKFAALGDSIDIMILDAAAVKNIAPLYQEDPRLFDGCKAWENGQVYLEMAYNAYYTNHEIALANAWYAAKVVYPDLFADVDMTAMALTSLAPYQEETDIKAAVDAALTYLSDAQQADGGFMSWGAANSESCAQVIVALTALGIDPAADSRFVKNGASPLDGLCAFACEGGGFRHSDEVWLPSRASTHWPPATASGRARHACST